MREVEVGPFSFWSAGTDNGVPRETHWRVRPMLLTLVGFAVVVVLVALFVHPSN
jgi:hypothetical protein